MIRVLQAVKAALSGSVSLAAVSIATGDGTGHRAPYIVLNVGGFDPDSDPLVPDEGDSVGVLNITCTAATPDAANGLLGAVEAILGRSVRSLAADGLHVQLRHDGAFGATVDRAVTLTGTNTHPAFSRVLYDIYTQSILEEIPDE